MADNVIQMPEPLANLAAGIRADLVAGTLAQDEFVTRTFRLAAKFAEAKGRFKSHIEFGHWCADEEFAILPDNRAALLNIDKHKEFALAILAETESRSWQLIWRNEIQPRLRNATITPPKTSISESAPEVAVIPEDSQTEECESRNISYTIPGKLRKSSPFLGRERAEEVHGIFTHPQTRSWVGKALGPKGRCELWKLILAAIDAGLLLPYHEQIQTTTLRLLFPATPLAYARHFDLSNKIAVARVRDYVLPALVAGKSEFLANPAGIENIVHRHQRKQGEAAQERRAVEAVSKLPSDEQELTMYGVRVWPRDPNKASYTYDQIRAAIWTFDEHERQLSLATSNSAASRAIIIRHSTNFMTQYVSREPRIDAEARSAIKAVYSLIHTLANLLESNPAGVCKKPYHPTTEGQW
jgi:hypothetical protein